MQRFEFNDEKSSKFWQVAQVGNALNIAWGKVGTNGQSQAKAFDTEAKASAAKDKLIAEKTGKGYVAQADALATQPVESAAKQVPEQASEQASDAAPAKAPTKAPTKAPAKAPDAAQTAAEPAAEPAAPARARSAKPAPATLDAAQSIEPEPRAPKPLIANGDAANAAALPAQPSIDLLVLQGLQRVLAHYAAEGFGDKSYVDDAELKRHKLLPAFGDEVGLPLLMQALVRSPLALHHHWGFVKLSDNTASAQAIPAFQAAVAAALAQPESAHGLHWSPDWATQWQWVLAHGPAMPATGTPSQWLGATRPVCVPGEHLNAEAVAQHLAQPLDVQLTALLGEGFASRANSRDGLYGVKVGEEAEWYAAQIQRLQADEASAPAVVAALAEFMHKFERAWHAMATIPRLDAFAQLAGHGDRTSSIHWMTDEYWALDAAIARWPFLAVAGLTQALAAARKPDVKLQAKFDALLGAMPQLWGDLPQALAPWLADAERDWLAARCARFQGPAEVAAAAELPPALAQPPWRTGRKPKPAVPIAVTPPEVAPAFHWPADERAAVLAADREWQRQLKTDAATLHPMQVASALNASDDKVADAIAAGDVQALIDAYRKSGGRWFSASKIERLPQALQIPFWTDMASSWATNIDTWVAHIGEAALPGLCKRIEAHPGENLDWAMRVGDASLAPVMAQRAFGTKSQRKHALAWLRAWPEHAVAGLLADAVGKPGKPRTHAGQALRYLAAPAQGQRARVLAMAARAGEPVVKAVEAVLAEDPMLAFPNKIAALPKFWQPQAWRRPQLRNGKALDLPTLDVLGEMLSFPRAEGDYPGIAQAKAACTPESLAAFAWDLFSAWLAADAPAKDNWPFLSLGALGGDEAARKLTPLIRAWPGEGGNARAVLGLDILEAIGSDTALMLLNGIAQKIKFKGLQDKAKEKIAAIAEARGLSIQELEDRLAPDLGLDAQGSLVLDFGPRQFKLGFDEALKPWLRDFTDGKPGARLKDLPKPNKADDAELASAATERYKGLKKDAKTIAAQQILRFETAMCQERLWTWDEFQLFIAQHPLVRHIAQRLVWGVFAVDAENKSGESTILNEADAIDATEDDDNAPQFPKHGGRLLTCFRLAEDGTATTADDAIFVLPDAPAALGGNQAIRIGVPHTLRISESDKHAFGQVFADYELLQPFDQLSRDTHALTEAERQSLALTRWENKTVAPGKVLGLLNRGWWRGRAQDGGGIWYFSKPVAAGRVIELGLNPGFTVGMMGEPEDQQLCGVNFGVLGRWADMSQSDHRTFAELGDIGASELIRDLDAICAA